MTSFRIFLAVTLVATGASVTDARRLRRGLSRIDANQQIFFQTLPNEYGQPSSPHSQNGSPSSQYGSSSHEHTLQETNYYLLNRIHSELNQIQSLIYKLLNQYGQIHHNTATIKSLFLPTEYGPPAPDSSHYNEKFLQENTQTIQSSIDNLKSIAEHLEAELNKHVQRPHSRLDSDKVPVLTANQHYHINAAGVLPDFLTLNPYVGYGPAPNVNFAPPAPGATSDSASLTDVFSPPDGVLLAPPAPGKFPIRTRENNLKR